MITICTICMSPMTEGPFTRFDGCPSLTEEQAFHAACYEALPAEVAEEDWEP